mmetsp:Transcript_80631/g.160863  ORF Transcript_80631/g.160863 Transcript_80631/m.160863 type:complete len:255 (+) Transcript_80631:333-1097(+)
MTFISSACFDLSTPAIPSAVLEASACSRSTSQSLASTLRRASPKESSRRRTEDDSCLTFSRKAAISSSAVAYFSRALASVPSFPLSSLDFLSCSSACCSTRASNAATRSSKACFEDSKLPTFRWSSSFKLTRVNTWALEALSAFEHSSPSAWASRSSSTVAARFPERSWSALNFVLVALATNRSFVSCRPAHCANVPPAKNRLGYACSTRSKMSQFIAVPVPSGNMERMMDSTPSGGITSYSHENDRTPVLNSK